MSSASPTVSVLVPCYNKRAYVLETLESVHAQTLTDLELIVVDDGSTDGSTELLERERTRCTVVLGENQGASAARQHALELSRGRFIQYLDADDVLLPTALEQRIAALETSGADIAYSGYQPFRRSASGELELDASIEQRLEDVHADPEVACFTRFWLPPVALTYRRSLIDRLPPWNPRLPVIQDARYLQEAAFAGARFVRVPGVLALYRVESDSLSRRNRAAFARDLVQNADEVSALLHARGSLSPAFVSALGDCYETAARMAFARDAQTFETCLLRLSALGKRRPLGWPSVAGVLGRVLGADRAAALLAQLGRPAG